ncbi:MAG: HD domain-containing protein, partial [Tissierellia bacterium]|nr:HD domain-containing protein [Tissierellia bacterium]
VGGSIRDMLLGKDPSDYDIATDAMPNRMRDLFHDFKIVDIGERFGTIIIIQDEGDVEVTTFRREGRYTDGRRPEWISFTEDIEEDLSRRDFTINAMAYSDGYGLIDPHDGRGDLERKIIRTVGCSDSRFSEDYLRILRAIRFCTQLGFVIDEATYAAAKRHCKGISRIGVERIVDEFFKIILSDPPSNGIRLLEDIGALNVFLPEVMPMIGFEQRNPYHTMDVYDHTLCVLDNTPPIIHMRLAALFHDIAKPHTLTIDEEGIGHFYSHDRLGADMAKEILKRFRVSNELIDKVYILVKEHMNHHSDFGERGLKRLIRRMGDEVFNLFILQEADIICSGKRTDIGHILERRARIESILREKEAYDVDQMNIDGNDLIGLGFEEGPIIGDILEYLLDLIMEDPALNDRDILMDRALKRFPMD